MVQSVRGTYSAEPALARQKRKVNDGLKESFILPSTLQRRAAGPQLAPQIGADRRQAFRKEEHKPDAPRVA